MYTVATITLNGSPVGWRVIAPTGAYWGRLYHHECEALHRAAHLNSFRRAA